MMMLIFDLPLRLLIVGISPTLLLFLLLLAQAIKATPTNHPSKTTPPLQPRIPRCDFPGEIYNRSLRTSLRFKYDVSSSSSSSSEESPPMFEYATLEPGQDSTSLTCDADFLEVDGYTLLVDDTAFGPLKDRPVEERTVLDGGEYKLDAYTLTCFEALDLPDEQEDLKNRLHSQGDAMDGEDADGVQGFNGTLLVRCHVRYNGNQP